MSKYIVKSCPAFRKMVTTNSSKGHKTLFDVCSEGKHCLCESNTDCPIKKAVYLVMADNDICKFIGRKEPVLNMQILQTLGVKEVENEN